MDKEIPSNPKQPARTVVTEKPADEEAPEEAPVGFLLPLAT
jgi:hypothetical protein